MGAPVEHVNASDRLDEIAGILALGVLRLRSRRSGKNHNHSNHLRAFGLDFRAGESVCGHVLSNGEFP